MNSEPNLLGCLAADLAAAVTRIRQLEDKLCEAEQELKAASEIIEAQEFDIECLRLQLEAVDLMIDETAETRRRLEKRIAELENEHDKPYPVMVPVPRDRFLRSNPVIHPATSRIRLSKP